MGQKLSKQSLAPAIDHGQAGELLVEALRFLGQTPPAPLAHEPLREIWTWALANWQSDRIPRRKAQLAPPSICAR
jgi:glutamyl-Q tRNA(Asp) synthetase